MFKKKKNQEDVWQHISGLTVEEDITTLNPTRY